MFCLSASRLASSLFVIVGSTSSALLSFFLAAAVAANASFLALLITLSALIIWLVVTKFISLSLLSRSLIIPRPESWSRNTSLSLPSIVSCTLTMSSWLYKPLLFFLRLQFPHCSTMCFLATLRAA